MQKLTKDTRITNHRQYDPGDYEYLRDKGYTNAEILEMWDAEAARFAEPCTHGEAPDLVGYLNEGVK